MSRKDNNAVDYFITLPYSIVWWFLKQLIGLYSGYKCIWAGGNPLNQTLSNIQVQFANRL